MADVARQLHGIRFRGNARGFKGNGYHQRHASTSYEFQISKYDWTRKELPEAVRSQQSPEQLINPRR